MNNLMFRFKSSLVRSSLAKPTRFLVNAQNVSGYSTKKTNKSNQLKFGSLILIGFVSYGILTFAIQGVDRRPKTHYSEEEYNKLVQDGLKRKIKFFPDSDNLSIYLFPSRLDNSEKLKELKNVNVIALEDLISREKETKLSKYGPLLLECEKSGSKVLVGVYSSIIGAEIERIRQSDPSQTRFLICGFPSSIEESIKFEDKIVSVTKLIATEDDDSKVAQYYNTVKKVEKVKNVEDIAKIIKN